MGHDTTLSFVLYNILGAAVNLLTEIFIHSFVRFAAFFLCGRGGLSCMTECIYERRAALIPQRGAAFIS